MCNCKKGNGVKRLNNLHSRDHVLVAEDVFRRIISKKEFSSLDDIDWFEIYGAYDTLYPNSSQKPGKEDCIEKIKAAIEFSRIKKVKR